MHTLSLSLIRTHTDSYAHTPGERRGGHAWQICAHVVYTRAHPHTHILCLSHTHTLTRTRTHTHPHTHQTNERSGMHGWYTHMQHTIHTCNIPAHTHTHTLSHNTPTHSSAHTPGEREGGDAWLTTSHRAGIISLEQMFFFYISLEFLKHIIFHVEEDDVF